MKPRLMFFMVVLFVFHTGSKRAHSTEIDIKAIENRLAQARGLEPSETLTDEMPYKCGAGLAISADYYSHLAGGEKINMLLGRPDSLSLTLASEHFVVHYIDSTSDIPYNFDEDVNPADGVPDYINRVSEIFEHAWYVEIESLGFEPPLPDFGLGGDDRYDIYVRNLGLGYYGFTVRDSIVRNNLAISHIEIENDFAESHKYIARPLDGVRVTAAHELFHGIQFAYDYYEYDASTGAPKPWWMEASATWMEDIVYDNINDYWTYLYYFYKFPWISLTTFAPLGDARRVFHPYGSCVWPIYMSEKYEDPLIVRDIWERCASQPGYNTLDATDGTLSSRGSNLDDAFLEFSVWNFHVGEAADTLRFFSEGDSFPDVDTTVIIDNLNGVPYFPFSNLQDSPEDMASNYIMVRPNPVTGGIQWLFDGEDIQQTNWQVAILGYRPRTGLWMKIPLSPGTWNGQSQWPNWDSYDAVVMIPSVTGVASNDTGNNIYSGRATFDSSLYLNYDVMITQFLSPVGAGRKGDPVTPLVRISNLGRFAADFTARLIIEHGDTIYNQTVAISSLEVNSATNVSFPEFVPNDVGKYILKAKAEYSQDQFPPNDSLSMVFISLGDVGRLLSAYPSPFVIEKGDDLLTIPFSFDPAFNGFNSKLHVYDISGGLVNEIPGDRYPAAGSSTFFGFKWDGKNSNGDYVASGIYIFLANASGQSNSGKIALINKIK